MSQEDKEIKKYKVYFKPIFVNGYDHIDACIRARKYCMYNGDMMEISNVVEKKD